MPVVSSNTILYCNIWEETVSFYESILKLPVLLSNEWFVEFKLSENSRLSVADSQRTTIKSSGGAGITLSLEVLNLEEKKNELNQLGIDSSPIKSHPWDAMIFYLYDPEGHRIEFWQRK